jgi:hypothetical protein
MAYILTSAIFYILGVLTGLLIYRKHQEKLKTVETKAQSALDALKK